MEGGVNLRWWSRRNSQQSAAIRRLACAFEPQPRHLFGHVVHRDLLTGFNDANRDVVTAATSGARIARVIDEPRGRLEQDVLAINSRNKDAFVAGKGVARAIGEHFAASTPIN